MLQSLLCDQKHQKSRKAIVTSFTLGKILFQICADQKHQKSRKAIVTFLFIARTEAVLLIKSETSEKPKGDCDIPSCLCPKASPKTISETSEKPKGDCDVNLYNRFSIKINHQKHQKSRKAIVTGRLVPCLHQL
eukprot:TRINITY_DN3050_c0_g1_i3.p1 TRINITY_DN3050_c0_g1~~TRINITY_DN3050_c0_g1_i3.p1  ORF type:complete len:134 (-),score=2.81 TRINITY_DN3050_c0_g1_i3:26-427(-)